MMNAKALRQHLNGKRAKAPFMTDKTPKGKKLPAGETRLQPVLHRNFVQQQLAKIAHLRAQRHNGGPSRSFRHHQGERCDEHGCPQFATTKQQ